MNHNSRVLVVGTTSDYIEWIRKIYPDQACFITDPSKRLGASEPVPSDEEEVLCDLKDLNLVRLELHQHLIKWDIHLCGIACFDCESMELAARLAEDYSLSYPSVQAIENSRDKYVSKTLWRDDGVKCPTAKMVRTVEEASDFFLKVGGPCVIKPSIGSGSELVFLCKSDNDLGAAVSAVLNGLEKRKDNSLFNGIKGPSSIIVEEFIEGSEYSSDFIIEREQVEIIRLTRKLRSANGHFGTIRGYVLENSLPEGISAEVMEETFKKAALTLGIRKAICMVDFIVKNKEMVLLELTPRPGGDCIPFLMRHAMGTDSIRLAMDFASRGHVTSGYNFDDMTYVGLRIHACNGGILNEIDTLHLLDDPRVLEIKMMRRPGHFIKMPSEDYDSWFLGHIIFRTVSADDIDAQCSELADMVDIKMG